VQSEQSEADQGSIFWFSLPLAGLL